MKKFRAFSLTEILIATIFMGIIASLTIPSTIESLKYREHVTAYKTAFEKVQQAASLAGLTDSSDASTQKFYATLNDLLPVIGYTDQLLVPENGNINVSGVVVPINVSTLYERALLYPRGKEAEGITIGGKTGSVVKGITDNFSPWIVTENGMAFSIRKFAKGSLLGMSSDTCGTVSNIIHAKEPPVSSYHEAAYYSCVFLLVDVNGLDKGPNKMHPYQPVTEGEARQIAKEVDMYHIYVGIDGVSAGPFETVPYWIMKDK